MLRNIAGIMADEEPKTPISASGLYNSSDTSSLVNASFSQDLLSGRSEFTFMCWAYIDATSGTLITTPYRENTAIGQSSIVIAGSGLDYIFVSLKNSNGGTTSLTANVTIDYQDWFHVAVTGSVLNGRVRAYYNGVLIDSATMTYSNATATSNELPNNNSVISLSQYNVYDRELTETEIAEHYVYDDDTMSSGVLGWDAMTPAQRSGLIYSSSFTDDISISGNEFNDKSGSGITISPQPSLTGEQIYFYTNASDLPSDTTIYNVNSVLLPSAGRHGIPLSVVNLANISITSYSFSINIKTTQTSFGLPFSVSNGVDSGLAMFINSAGAGTGVANKAMFGVYDGVWNSMTAISTTSINDGNWHHIVGTWDASARTTKIYVDGVLEHTNVSVSNAINGTTVTSYMGESMDGSGISFTDLFAGVLTQAQVDMLTDNLGNPTCYASRPTELDSLYLGSWNLGNYDGNAGTEEDDQSGNGNDLTPTYTPTYTDQGLQVECTS